MLRQEITRTVSSMSACGEATFGKVRSGWVLVFETVIPRGTSSRSRTAASHDFPVLFATICPAATYMMFW